MSVVKWVGTQVGDAAEGNLEGPCRFLCGGFAAQRLIIVHGWSLVAVLALGRQDDSAVQASGYSGWPVTQFLWQY